MNIRRWINTFRSFPLRKQRPMPHRTRYRPIVESLEDRVLPTGSLYGMVPTDFFVGEGGGPTAGILAIDTTTGAQTPVWTGADNWYGPGDGTGHTASASVAPDGTIFFIGCVPSGTQDPSIDVLKINPSQGQTVPTDLGSAGNVHSLVLGPDGTLYGMVANDFTVSGQPPGEIVTIDTTTGAQTPVWTASNNLYGPGDGEGQPASASVASDGTIFFIGCLVYPSIDVLKINPSQGQTVPTDLGSAGDVHSLATTVFPPTVWTGDGSDDLWSDVDNWLGGVAPTAGANLVFPSGAQQETNVNDLGFTFNSVTIQDSYNFSGQTLTVTGNIDCQQGSTEFDCLVTVNGTTSIDAGASVTVGATGTLDANGPLTVAANASLTNNNIATLNGDVTVAANAIFLDNKNMTIGTIADPAQVSVSAMGNLTVGSNASLTLNGSVILDGLLEVESGGVMVAVDITVVAGVLQVDGSLTVGYDLDNLATVLIYGTVEISPAGHLHDLSAGVTVEPGGLLSDQDAITVAAGATLDVYGTLTEGDGGNLDITGTVIIESDAALNDATTITVEAGGLLDVAGALIVSSTGLLDVAGALSVSSTGSLDVFGTVNLQPGAAYSMLGTLTVEPGGAFTYNDATTTSVTSDPVGPIIQGDAVSFTATIANADPGDVGTVSFYFDYGAADQFQIGGAVNVSNGSATSAATTALPVGDDTITAIYSGGVGFEASQGTDTLTVNQTTTTTTLTDNGPNPSNYFQAVSFTATVSGGSAISGETVLIEDADNANTVVASPTLSNGAVTFTTNLTVGTHHLFAVYNGDSTHAGSDDSLTPVVQIVNYDTVLFVTGSDGVDEFTTSGTLISNFVPIGTGGLDGSAGNLRFGPDGNLYVCDGAYVKEYSGASGAFLGNFASGLSYAFDIIFDNSGNAYVSDYSGDAVDMFSSTGTLLQTFSSGVSTPAGLAFAPNGDLLVANTYVAPYANTITELNTTTGSYSTFATGLGEPVGLIEGADGKYYAGNFTFANSYGGTNPDTIQVIPSAGGVSSTWNTGGNLDGTDFLAFADGDLFATSYYNNQVVRFDGATGAFVNSFSAGGNIYGITVHNLTTPVFIDNGPNPSISGQPVSFYAVVNDFAPTAGNTVTIEDASNGNAVVASPTLGTGGTVNFTISNLTVGLHSLFFVYNGDALNGGTISGALLQQVIPAPPAITSVVINQNISALYNAAGQPFAGAQRSMVDDIVYTFSEPVNILNPGIDPNVFTVAVASGWTGTVPTLSWAPVAGSNSTQWAVTFSGNGVTGGSIDSGAYTITVTDPWSIFAVSDGQALSLDASGIGGATQSFFRLFGDINGDEVVNAADNAKFKQALTSSNAAFDFNSDGVVNAADNAQFKVDLSVNFSGFTATI
jgi:trimeric autotransporter adhesin